MVIGWLSFAADFQILISNFQLLISGAGRLMVTYNIEGWAWIFESGLIRGDGLREKTLNARCSFSLRLLLYCEDKNGETTSYY